MHSLTRLIFLFFLFGFSQVSLGKVISLKWDEESQSVLGVSEFLKDDSKQLTLKDILSDKQQIRFTPLEHSDVNQGIDNAAYWIKFSIYNPRANGVTWVLYPELSTQDNMEIWVKAPNGKWLYNKQTDHADFNKRSISYRLLNATFKIKSQETTTVYVKLSSESKDFANLNLYVSGQSNLREILAKEYMFYGMYYGLFLASILLIMSIWLYAETYSYKYYFYFLSYLTCNIFMWLSVNGLSFQLLWPSNPTLHNQSLHILYLLVTIFGFLFSRELLNTKKKLPKIDRVLRLLIVIFIIAIALRVTNFAHDFVFYTAAFGLLSLATLPLLAWLCYKKGAIYLVFYIIAWLPYSISTLLHFFSNAFSLTRGDYSSLLVSQFSVLFECFMLIIATLSKMQYRSKKLIKLTLQDPLTSLGNRRQLEEHAIALKNHRQDNRQYWLLLIDLDHFKKINDTYGHAVGDEVIVGLSTLLKKVCRKRDVAIRWGGEEFVLLVTVEQSHIALEIAERIRTKFANTPISQDQNQFNVSLSIGLNQLNFSSAEPLNDAVKLADDALYKAKENGRNQCVVN